MAWTYDITTDRGKTRLLCIDSDTTQQIFSDAEIDAFLAMEDGDIHLAAANALDTIASKTVYILKVVKLMDLQVEGDKVSDDLRSRASELRRQVYEGHGDMKGLVDWAEFAEQPFSSYERLWKQWERTGV
jgi:hypothetical protein